MHPAIESSIREDLQKCVDYKVGALARWTDSTPGAVKFTSKTLVSSIKQCYDLFFDAPSGSLAKRIAALDAWGDLEQFLIITTGSGAVPDSMKDRPLGWLYRLSAHWFVSMCLVEGGESIEWDPNAYGPLYPSE